MPDPSHSATPRRFTKLIVEDLDRAAAFYQSVCGLVEEWRGDDAIAGRPMREVHFKLDPPGNGSFTLTKFLDAPRPQCQAMILGFVVGDIEAFVSAATEAGAELVQDIHPRAEYGVKVAFLNDPEGNLMEIVELV